MLHAARQRPARSASGSPRSALLPLHEHVHSDNRFSLPCSPATCVQRQPTCNHVHDPRRTSAYRQPDASRPPTPTCDAHRNLQPTSTILHYPYLIKPKTQRTGGATRNGATQPTNTNTPTNQRATRPNGAASGEARTGVRTGPRRPRRRAGPRRARAARMPMARARLTRDRPCTDSGDHAPAAPSNAKVAIEISIFRVPARPGHGSTHTPRCCLCVGEMAINRGAPGCGHAGARAATLRYYVRLFI